MLLTATLAYVALPLTGLPLPQQAAIAEPAHSVLPYSRPMARPIHGLRHLALALQLYLQVALPAAARLYLSLVHLAQVAI